MTVTAMLMLNLFSEYICTSMFAGKWNNHAAANRQDITQKPITTKCFRVTYVTWFPDMRHDADV